MDTLTRQWLILRMIPRLGCIATTEVLGRLQNEYSVTVSLRTIQRDMLDLSGIFPITSDDNHPTGWKWVADADSLILPTMDPLSALTFRLVQDSMTRLLPRAAFTSLNGYFKAAATRLKNLQEPNLARWPDKVRVISRSLCLEAPKIEERILDLVYEALQQERRFTAVYQQKPGKLKTYEVNPLGLVFVDSLIYLVATLNEHNDPIQLLVHKIREITMLVQKAEPPAGFSLQGYIDSGEFGYPLGGMIKLKALFEAGTAQHLYESGLTAEQKLTEKPDGRVQLEAAVRDDVQLRWWLKGFGERVEVIAPKALRDEFIETAQALAGIYGSNR